MGEHFYTYQDKLQNYLYAIVIFKEEVDVKHDSDADKKFVDKISLFGSNCFLRENMKSLSSGKLLESFEEAIIVRFLQLILTSARDHEQLSISFV